MELQVDGSKCKGKRVLESICDDFNGIAKSHTFHIAELWMLLR